MDDNKTTGGSTKRSLQSSTLVDLLDRILDKGVVIAGDIVIQLADVELITIKIRLIVCSVDKAEAIGMDWWRHDTFLSSKAPKRKVESTIPVKTISSARRILKTKTKKKRAKK